MKEPKVFHIAIVTDEEAGAADSGYLKLYAKEDGFYSRDEDGEPVRLEGIVVVDDDGEPLDQKRLLQFKHPLTARLSEDETTIVVSLFGEEEDEDDDWTGFMHGNEFHDPDFATQADLQGHIDDETVVHGLDIEEINANSHTQNTDTALDEGGANHVTAAQLRSLFDASIIGGLLLTGDAETSVTGAYGTYLADTSGGNVSFVLPVAANYLYAKALFRKVRDENAMTVYRSGDDNIIVDGDSETLLSFEDKGDWVEVQSDGTNWHVIAGSI